MDTQGKQLPYISEQDEVYINDNEVRILKLVNGEVDYKAQALQIDYVPLLLENQEKGGFVVDLKPDITMPTFALSGPNISFSLFSRIYSCAAGRRLVTFSCSCR